ncbi:MAG: hypothetical protein WCR07_04330 [Verrucomicrobiota bacterium]|jgi:hypothetical protein
MKCFKGCARVDILAAAGLALRDLGPDRPESLARSPFVKARTHARVPRPQAPAAEDPFAIAEAASKRARWPAFEPPTAEDLRALAALRGFAVDGLRLAVARGVLGILPDFMERRAWVVTDASRNAAQARRLDGLPWPTGDGKTAKALSLLGTRGRWPVGLAAIRPEHEAILFLEGGPDLLAAHVHLWAEGREANAAAVGLMGAWLDIESAALPAFAGKRVRIVADADDAGQEAAKRWATSLHPIAASVDVVTLGTIRRRNGAPVKDLADAFDLDADTWEAARVLRSLMP